MFTNEQLNSVPLGKNLLQGLSLLTLYTAKLSILQRYEVEPCVLDNAAVERKGFYNRVRLPRGLGYGR
jgi:hypothetical protein